MDARDTSISGERPRRLVEEAPTSVLGRVCAPGWVILPQPLHHILDSPDLLLDLPVEYLILKQQDNRSKEVAVRRVPAFSLHPFGPAGDGSPVRMRALTAPSSMFISLRGRPCPFGFYEWNLELPEEKALLSQSRAPLCKHASASPRRSGWSWNK